MAAPVSQPAAPAVHQSALQRLFGALVTGGTPATRVLKPSGTQTLADGGVGLVVSAAERQEAEALVDLAEMLSLFRLRAQQATRRKRAKS